MRLFLQLPFGAPIVAAPGCRALADFQPNLRLCATAVEMAAALEQLRAVHFDDGRRLARWTHARTATWEFRAETARRVLQPWLDAAPAAP
jgi:hypothetical protein